MADAENLSAEAATDGPKQDAKSKEEELKELREQADAKYAIKDYRASAEFYSRAAEIQAELNGDMSIENADLLYSYGKCLYQVAVLNSDVLGAKAAAEKTGGAATKDEAPPVKPSSTLVKEIPKQEDKAEAGDEAEQTGDSKPFFTFEGDQNFDVSDDEEEGGEEEGDDAEEDDFSNAFEVLDLARVLLQRRLESIQKAEGDSKDPQAERTVEERLADTYDLQAEISLENEQFANAATDLKSAMELKLKLYPTESSLIAEGHFKLSLALEFSSVKLPEETGNDAGSGQDAEYDESLRKESAEQMELAIRSCKSRIESEEKKIQAMESAGDAKSDDLKKAKDNVTDVKEMVQDMEQRLVELRKPPVSVNDAQDSEAVNGLLGTLLGESSERQKQLIEEASKNANDLTSFIKKKKKESGEGGTPAPAEDGSAGKRKFASVEDEGQDSDGSKKVKV